MKLEKRIEKERMISCISIQNRIFHDMHSEISETRDVTTRKILCREINVNRQQDRDLFRSRPTMFREFENVYLI